MEQINEETPMKTPFRYLTMAMKVSVLFALCIAPGVSSANKIIKIAPDAGVQLVECLITSSDFQEIQILELVDGTFALRTLDLHGTRTTYELPRSQWMSKPKKILVPCWQSASSTCGVMTENSPGQWSYELTGSTGTAEGNCR